MFCNKCGASVSDEARVCTNCGEILNAAPVAAPKVGPKPNKPLKIVALIVLLLSVIGIAMPIATAEIMGETEYLLLGDAFIDRVQSDAIPAMFVLYFLSLPVASLAMIIGLVIPKNTVNRVFFGISKVFTATALLFSFIGTAMVASELSEAFEAMTFLGQEVASVSLLGYTTAIMVAISFILQFIKGKKSA